jgi:hypothetical protein
MANGAHAALHTLLDAPETHDQWIELGEAMASAMALFSWGFECYKNNRVPPEIKTAGGRRIAKLYHLRQAFDGADFDAVAAREGKRAIRQQVDFEFKAQHGIELPDSLLDLLADGVLEAVRRVEQAMAN